MTSFSILEISAISFFASLIATFIAVPFVIENSRKAGMVGKDRNKKDQDIPEMGGIAIVFGLSIGLLSAIAFGFNLPIFNKILLLATLATVLMIGFLGVIDDLYVLKRKVKAPIPFLAAIPLSSIRAGTRIWSIPFYGALNLGSFYQLVAIPLGIGGASNAFNMLAGLNGLEAGMGIVISLAIAIASYLNGSLEALVISLSLFASLIAFLWFNRYPSKIFPGDVGTYTIGVAIASAAIVGNLEFLGIVLFIPYFIEFILKLRTGFRGQCFGIMQKDGTLKAPPRIESLTHVIMRLKPMKEPQIVYVFVLLESMLAVSVLLFLFSSRIF